MYCIVPQRNTLSGNYSSYFFFVIDNEYTYCISFCQNSCFDYMETANHRGLQLNFVFFG